jgi:hypothetical protein
LVEIGTVDVADQRAEIFGTGAATSAEDEQRGESAAARDFKKTS